MAECGVNEAGAEVFGADLWRSARILRMAPTFLELSQAYQTVLRRVTTFCRKLSEKGVKS